MILHRALLLLAVVAAHLPTVSTSSHDGDATDERFLLRPQQCRCQAEYENFYDRRLLDSNVTSSTGAAAADRDLKSVYIDKEGYYHVDGVKILDCRVDTHQIVEDDEDEDDDSSGYTSQASPAAMENLYNKIAEFSKIFQARQNGNGRRRLVGDHGDGDLYGVTKVSTTT